jgi:hypothetical protein
MIKYFFTFLVFFGYSTFSTGQEAPLKNKSWRPVLMEAQAFTKDQLTRDFKGATGLNEFILQVTLEIDERKLENILGSSREDIKKLDGVQLPGLFKPTKEGYSTIDLREPTKEDLLISIKKIKVSVSYFQEKFPQSSAEAIILKIISSNYPMLRENQKEISILKEANHYPAEIAEIKVEKPISSFWEQHFKQIIVTGIFILVLVAFIGLTLRGGMSKISEVIKSKKIESAPQAEKVHNSARNPETSLPSIGKSNISETFESYVHASEHLANLVIKESKICNEIIVLKLMVEDFMGLSIMLDILAKDKKEFFFNNLEHHKKERYKDFIVATGSEILNDEAKLKEETIKIIKLIKITALSPENLYRIVLVDLVTSLQEHEAKSLIVSCTSEEKAFVCDRISPEQIAMFLQHETLSAEDIGMEVTDLTKEESVELIIKASSLKKWGKVLARQEKLELVYAQIEITKAELLAETIGIKPTMRFEFLFAKYQAEGLRYIQDMNYDELSALYPLLTKSMQEQVLGSLPELLSERLQFSKKVINAQSLKLKGEFYFYLKAFSENDNSPFSMDFRLSA